MKKLRILTLVLLAVSSVNQSAHAVGPKIKKALGYTLLALSVDTVYGTIRMVLDDVIEEEFGKDSAANNISFLLAMPGIIVPTLIAKYNNYRIDNTSLLYGLPAINISVALVFAMCGLKLIKSAQEQEKEIAKEIGEKAVQ